MTSFLRHLDREPPPGYTATSLSQLIKADQEVWARLAEAGSNIRRDAAGNLPLDGLLIQTLESYEIAFYLLPMMSGSSSSGTVLQRTWQRWIPIQTSSIWPLR